MALAYFDEYLDAHNCSNVNTGRAAGNIVVHDPESSLEYGCLVLVSFPRYKCIFKKKQTNMNNNMTKIV